MDIRQKKISLLVMFLSLLILADPVSATDLKLWNKTIIFLPEKLEKIFPRLYADPFDTQMGLTKKLNVNQLIGRIGQNVYLFHFIPSSDGDAKDTKGMYLAMTGYSWTLLSREGNRFPLMAVDYLLAGFFDFYYHQAAIRLEYSHISGHLGDKFASEDIDILPRVYSREFISGYASITVEPFIAYGGIHFIYHSIPKVKLVNLQGGLMFGLGDHVLEGNSPYFAIDLQAIGEFNYFINTSIQVGARLFYQNQRDYRLAVTYYNGYSVFGQYYDRKRKYISAGFYLDY